MKCIAKQVVIESVETAEKYLRLSFRKTSECRQDNRYNAEQFFRKAILGEYFPVVVSES